MIRRIRKLRMSYILMSFVLILFTNSVGGSAKVSPALKSNNKRWVILTHCLRRLVSPGKGYLL
jgi:hypothetical protein